MEISEYSFCDKLACADRLLEAISKLIIKEVIVPKSSKKSGGKKLDVKHEKLRGGNRNHELTTE